jgi:hypothetical protein
MSVDATQLGLFLFVFGGHDKSITICGVFLSLVVSQNLDNELTNKQFTVEQAWLLLDPIRGQL